MLGLKAQSQKSQKIANLTPKYIFKGSKVNTGYVKCDLSIV